MHSIILVDRCFLTVEMLLLPWASLSKRPSVCLLRQNFTYAICMRHKSFVRSLESLLWGEKQHLSAASTSEYMLNKTYSNPILFVGTQF